MGFEVIITSPGAGKGNVAVNNMYFRVGNGVDPSLATQAINNMQTVWNSNPNLSTKINNPQIVQQFPSPARPNQILVDIPATNDLYQSRAQTVPSQFNGVRITLPATSIADSNTPAHELGHVIFNQGDSIHDLVAPGSLMSTTYSLPDNRSLNQGTVDLLLQSRSLDININNQRYGTTGNDFQSGYGGFSSGSLLYPSANTNSTGFSAYKKP